MNIKQIIWDWATLKVWWKTALVDVGALTIFWICLSVFYR